MLPRIIVTHPGRQHSHELAAALYSKDWLASYVHGGPLPASSEAQIPTVLRHKLSYCRLVRRALHHLLPSRHVHEAYHHLVWSFDLLMAQFLKRGHYDAVVACETAALHEFRVARRLGMICILDNPGVHHSLQDRMLSVSESEAFHRRVVARKDEEIALADIIIVCSSFAAESFIAGGVPREKVHVVPLGCDTATFSQTKSSRNPTEPVRFLFVGRINRLKGADTLASAVERLRVDNVPFKLSVVAPVEEADPDCLAALEPVADLKGKISHSKLPDLHAVADCLVLPSRFDSFGFVVAEALASGLPVIISDSVGAKDMVDPAYNGWIVPSGDDKALADRMRWCALNQVALRTMRDAARATAERYSWSRYYSSLTLAIEPLIMDKCSSISSSRA